MGSAFLRPTMTFERAGGARPYILRDVKFLELISKQGSWVTQVFFSIRTKLSNELKLQDLTLYKSKNSKTSYVWGELGFTRLFLSPTLVSTQLEVRDITF